MPNSASPQGPSSSRRCDALDPTRPRRTPVAPYARSSAPAWSAVGSIAGDARVVRAQLASARRRLRPEITLRAVGIDQVAHLARTADALRLRRTAAALHAIQPLLGLTAGAPTNATLAAIGWACTAPNAATDTSNLDADDAGLLYLIPAVRFTGSDAARFERLCRSTAAACGVEVAITLNTISAFALEGVVSVSFRSDSAADHERAHAWLHRARDAVVDAGFPCMRLDVESLACGAYDRHPTAHLANTLKDALDPSRTISPGRYSDDRHLATP